MTKYDNEDIERILEVYLEDHMESMDKTINTGELQGCNYPSDDIIPIILKQTYEAQKTLKKSQDNLNILTGVLVIFTIVLAILTALLYFKS